VIKTGQLDFPVAVSLAGPAITLLRNCQPIDFAGTRNPPSPRYLNYFVLFDDRIYSCVIPHTLKLGSKMVAALSSGSLVFLTEAIER